MPDGEVEAADADALIERLGLSPHPEGGHFRETWRERSAGGGRGRSTSILFLLREGEHSHWHRVRDADEIWLFHRGSPLELGIAREGEAARSVTLGPDLLAGHSFQAVVPRNAWQAARPLGGWSLVGCVVAPAFEFSGFEMAPPGWSP